MITIKNFCERHEACQEGIDWAMSQGVSTMAELWELDMRPDWRIWIATREGAIDPNKQRLFACFCARQVWPLLTDERSRRMVEVAEQHAAGQATDEELAEARQAAWAAVCVAWAAYARAEAAAWGAAWAAWGAAAPWAAVAAWEAAVAAASARAAAEKEQAQWLIDNIDKGEIS